MFTWRPDDMPSKVQITLVGWIRVVLRGICWILVLVAGVLATLLLRGPERIVFGLGRPWTPYVTQWVCRLTLWILGIRLRTQGTPMKNAGAVVSNHLSWLDIFALNVRKRIYFVSKSEVAGWPGIGTLAKITGTVFITRDPRQAQQQTQIFESRLLQGHKLLFFPEGTSTDGMRVLPFKSTLFEAFFSQSLRPDMNIQPVSLVYTAPHGEDARFYGWWGDMEFAPHVLKVLAQAPQGEIKIIYHPPVKVDDFPNRKALAGHLAQVVRAGMPPERQQT